LPLLQLDTRHFEAELGFEISLVPSKLLPLQPLLGQQSLVVGTKEGVEELEMGRESGINAKTITQGVKFIHTKGDSD